MEVMIIEFYNGRFNMFDMANAAIKDTNNPKIINVVDVNTSLPIASLNVNNLIAIYPNVSIEDARSYLLSHFFQKNFIYPSVAEELKDIIGLDFTNSMHQSSETIGGWTLSSMGCGGNSCV